MYTGIYDMPIGRWWDANEQDDPIHLVRFGFLKFLYRSIFRLWLLKRWKRIRDEFFDKIALTRELEAYILKIIRLESVRVDMLIHAGTAHGRYLNTQYTVKSIEIKSIEKKQALEGKDNFYYKAALSKNIGFRIDENVSSIAEYHGYIKEMQAEYQRMKTLAKKNG